MFKNAFSQLNENCVAAKKKRNFSHMWWILNLSRTFDIKKFEVIHEVEQSYACYEMNFMCLLTSFSRQSNIK
jgi:hypothetical protein